MLDMSMVSSLHIPEGEVQEISKGAEVLWTLEKWDIEWISSGSLPDSSIYEYPVGTGTTSYDSTYNAVKLYSPSGDTNTGAGLRYRNYLSAMGTKATFEVELLITSTVTNTGGIRLMLGEAVNGIASTRGLKIAINCGSSTSYPHEVNVIRKTAGITHQNGVAEFSLNEWHKVRLSLNTVDNVNKVYLDGVEVYSEDNSALSTTGTDTWHILANRGTAYVRAFRYRKDA